MSETLCSSAERGMLTSRTHLTKRIEDSVQHDEKREYRQNRLQGTTDDESEDCLHSPVSAICLQHLRSASTYPTEESKRHRLLSPNLVHQEAAHDTSWQIKAVDCCTKTNVLNQRPIRIELRDDGSREYAKWVGHKVIPTQISLSGVNVSNANLSHT